MLAQGATVRPKDQGNSAENITAPPAPIYDPIRSLFLSTNSSRSFRSTRSRRSHLTADNSFFQISRRMVTTEHARYLAASGNVKSRASRGFRCDAPFALADCDAEFLLAASSVFVSGSFKSSMGTNPCKPEGRRSPIFVFVRAPLGDHLNLFAAPARMHPHRICFNRRKYRSR